MMKKILMGLAAIALISTSCSKNETTESVNDGKGALKYSTITGLNTRASEAGLDQLKDAELPLLAWYKPATGNSSQFFSETLQYTSAWGLTSGTTYYKPTTGTLHFFSVYPVATTIIAPTAADGTDAKIVGYEVKAEADQEDLMAAYFTLETGTNVTMPFKHLLSQINFGVVGLDNHIITISNIKVGADDNIANKGTYTFSSDVWSDPSGAAGYTYMDREYPTGGGASDSGVTYIFGDGGNSAVGTAGATLVYGTTVTAAENGPLMLMPQTLTDKNFTFDFVIKNTTSNVELKSGTNVEAPLGVTGDITAWLPQKRYVYILDFSNLLTALTFDVLVSEWENWDKGINNPDTGKVTVSLP